jgi:tetratricopeptide (TPR) repeat protein
MALPFQYKYVTRTSMLQQKGLIFFTGAVLFCTTPTFAQQEFSSPELKQMYQSATDYLARKDYDNAIMMYAQAIRLAPDNVMLRRDLAYTYFVAGKREKAKEIIDPVVNSELADEQTYQVASAVEASLDNRKQAKKILNNGLKKYPNSGLLYQAKGNLLHAEEKGAKEALQTWVEGIKAEPSFAANYYSAAKGYLNAGNPVWALLLGETFINLDEGTAKAAEIKSLMLDAYRQLFSPADNEKLPDFRAEKNSNSTAAGFTGLYKSVMTNNAAAISDGLNVENLIMLRTRFILEWFRNYSIHHSSTLFAYHDKLIRSGHFDAYNQWLFGAASNSQEFSNWVKMNSKQYGDFEQWKKRNPYQPSISDPLP